MKVKLTSIIVTTLFLLFCRGALATPELQNDNSSVAAVAQPQSQFPRVRVEVAPVVFLPVGQWRAHPYQIHEMDGAADLDYFGTGFGGSAEVSLQFLEWFGVAAGFTGTSLSTRDWERYAEDSGSQIDARGYLWQVHLMTIFDVIPNPRFGLDVRSGLAAMFPGGKEENADYNRTDDYDFFRPTLGLIVGLRSSVALTSLLDFTLGCDFTIGFNGLEHTGEREQDIMGLSFNLGLRFVTRRELPRNGGES